jgi:2-polyprenyl-3-methyl-5-hydroxy-6-metoxy-1,4-benzoquinol methylase
VLEVGAGTGHLSKALAENRINITAIEPSVGMFVIAKEVLDGIDVELVNCSLESLPANGGYGVVLSHLVVHVVPDMPKFFSDVAKHIEQSGHFIFTIPHPCFYNDYKKIFGTEYRYMQQASKEISFTISKDPSNVISGVPYHHRPLSQYMKAILRSGFAITEFEETWPDQEIQMMYGQEWNTPRYCMFVCKKI